MIFLDKKKIQREKTKE